MITGTIRNAVQQITLDTKWQQRKNDITTKKQVELTPEQKQIQMYQEQADDMRESDKDSNIYAKIRTGSTLSLEEEEYLRKNNPDALKEYKELKEKRKAFRNQLEQCDTKEEVEEVKIQKMGMFMAEANQISNNSYIPKGKKVELMGKLLAEVINVADTYKDFVQSANYANLPTEEERKEMMQGDEEPIEERSLDDSVNVMDRENMEQESDTEETKDMMGGENVTFDQMEKSIEEFLKKETVASGKMDVRI